MSNKNYTYEILGGYLMNNNKLNTEYVAHCISVTVENNEKMWNMIVKKDGNKMSFRNIAITCLKYFVDIELKYNGYPKYSCTNSQLMSFDKDHENTLTEVLNILEKSFEKEYEEYKEA